MATSPKFFNIHHPSQFIVHVEINRPSKYNAFHQPMWLELRRIFTTLSTDPSTRAILITGAGPKAFTAGLDTKEAATSGPLAENKNNPTADAARKAAILRRHIAEFQECISAVARCEKPVICVLHGFAYGLAVDLSSACDVRYCAADTRFCVKEVDIGLAADVGTLTRLPKVVGNMSWVKEVCYSAREFGAEEARRQGFVSEVFGDKEHAVKAAMEWAKLIASKSPVAVQGTKRILDYSVDHSVEDGLHYTAVWNSAMLQTDDTLSAMKAGWAKKTPTFEKL